MLSAMMYLFGGLAGRQRLFCGRVISLVYRVNMLFITDVIYYGRSQRPVDIRRDDLLDG